VTSAQSDTTSTTIVERTDPSRPLTDTLVDWFGLESDSLTAGLVGSVIEPVLQIALIFLFAVVGVRFLKRGVRRLVARSKVHEVGISFGDDAPPSTRKQQRVDALGEIAESTVSVVVWLIALLTVLGTTFGVDITPLLAGAGILGLAIGFGAQDLVKDVISGVFMLVEDQYGLGDVIDAGEAVGVVEGIGLRSTRIRDVTGTLWHLPNGEIRRIGNMSQEWSRALLDIGVAYGSDVDEAAAVIKDVADEMSHEDTYSDVFLGSPEIWGVESLSADSVEIRLVIKTKPGEQWAISRELRRRIKLALDRARIEIPFPQRTVWLRHETDDEEPLEPIDLSSGRSARDPKRGRTRLPHP